MATWVRTAADPHCTYTRRWVGTQSLPLLSRVTFSGAEALEGVVVQMSTAGMVMSLTCA